MSAVSRRHLIQGAGIAGVGLLAGCGRLPWLAQVPAPVPRIAFLSNAPLASLPVGALRQGLREHGYVEGQSIHVEYRSAETQGDTGLTELAAELLQVNPAVLIASCLREPRGQCVSARD
jgi:putative tryptophan/tyrosine transport system substrate-binding protein